MSDSQQSNVYVGRDTWGTETRDKYSKLQDVISANTTTTTGGGSSPVPVANTQAQVLASQLGLDKIIAWIKAHPILVIGGIGALVWFFYFRKGGSGNYSKTRTDITRWS